MLSTLADVFVESGARGSSPAMTFVAADGLEHSVSHSELYEKACAWAHEIEKRTPDGAHVAVMGAPSPEWYAAFIGIQLSARIAAPLSPMYAPQELQRILDRLDPHLVVLGESIRDDTSIEVQTSYGDRIVRLARAGSTVPTVPGFVLDPARWTNRGSPDEPAVVLHTSGTTGLPKAAIQTHANYVGFVRHLGAHTILPGERVISFLAPTHQAGLLLTFITAIARGGHVTQLERFNPDIFWSAVRRHGCTVGVLMSPAPGRLLAAPERPDDRDHTLRRALGGSTPSEQRRLLCDRFGITFSHEQIGSTETTLFALSGDVDRCGPWPTGGLAGPLGGSLAGREVDGWARVRIADTTSEEVLSPGVLGEIQVAGPGVFSGYLRDPDQTAAVFTHDGWFRTGDLGYMDKNRNVYWVDRLKTMIRRSGENVSPAEVEQVVAQVSTVAHVAAFGVPDDIRGEEIMISLVPRPGHSIDVDHVISHCVDHLSAFKVPRYVEIAEELPMTVSHKIRRDVLKHGWAARVVFDRLAERSAAFPAATVRATATKEIP